MFLVLVQAGKVERSNHSFSCAFSVSPPEETEECIMLWVPRGAKCIGTG